MSHATTQNLSHLCQATYLGELGVSPEEFDADPMGSLDRVGQYDALSLLHAGRRPLLPAQVRLRRELEQQWDAAGTPVARRPRAVGVRGAQCVFRSIVTGHFAKA